MSGFVSFDEWLDRREEARLEEAGPDRREREGLAGLAAFLEREGLAGFGIVQRPNRRGPKLD